MIIFFISIIAWIFIGQLIISHLIDNKGCNISNFWEWNPLWFLGLFELLDTEKILNLMTFNKREKYYEKQMYMDII